MRNSLVLFITVLISFSSCQNHNITDLIENNQNEIDVDVSSRAVTISQFFDGKEELKLSEITVVGSHNAYFWDTYWPNQNWSIKTQFDNGVRFMEIDVYRLNGNLITGHGLNNSGGINVLGGTNKLDKVLGWFKDFLDDNPGELLMILWEYHENDTCGVSWAEIEGALEDANLDDYIYKTTNGMADPTAQQLIDAGTRLIFRNQSGLRRKTSGGYPDHFDGLNRYDRVNYTDYSNPARLHSLTASAQDGIVGDEEAARIINQDDFLVRYIQRAWLYNGQRPTIISSDFVDKGDVFSAVNQVMDYNVYKGSISGYPASNPTIFWTLKYSNGMTKAGMSGEFFDFPGEIDYMGTIYNLISITPAAFDASVTLDSNTPSSRGGVTYNDMVYTYNSSGTSLLTSFPDGNYYLRNDYSGKYLTVENGSTANEANLVSASFGGYTYQTWTFTKKIDNGYHYIKSANSGKQVSLKNGQNSRTSRYDSYFNKYYHTELGQVENAIIHQYGTDTNNVNNEWFLFPLSYGSRKCMVISRESGRAMTFPSTGNNVGLVSKEMGLLGHIWQLEDATKVAFLGSRWGKYIVAEDNGGNEVNADREDCGSFERFQLINNDSDPEIIKNGDIVSIKTGNGHYFRASSAGALNADRTVIGSHETFTLINHTDSSGHIEDGDLISLKSYHNKYVAAEYWGAANADRTAIGSYEKFIVIMD